jgi:hypothetical protein
MLGADLPSSMAKHKREKGIYIANEKLRDLITDQL